MKKYEEKEVKCLISKPRGLWLARRRRSLRRAGVEVKTIYTVPSTPTIPNFTQFIPTQFKW